MSKVERLELTRAQLGELAALNATAPGPHRVAATRHDGGSVLAAELLTDCGEGQTFAHFGNFLRSLAAEKNDDPKPITPASEQKPKTRKK